MKSFLSRLISRTSQPNEPQINCHLPTNANLTTETGAEQLTDTPSYIDNLPNEQAFNAEIQPIDGHPIVRSPPAPDNNDSSGENPQGPLDAQSFSQERVNSDPPSRCNVLTSQTHCEDQNDPTTSTAPPQDPLPPAPASEPPLRHENEIEHSPRRRQSSVTPGSHETLVPPEPGEGDLAETHLSGHRYIYRSDEDTASSEFISDEPPMQQVPSPQRLHSDEQMSDLRVHGQCTAESIILGPEGVAKIKGILKRGATRSESIHAPKGTTRLQFSLNDSSTKTVPRSSGRANCVGDSQPADCNVPLPLQSYYANLYAKLPKCAWIQQILDQQQHSCFHCNVPILAPPSFAYRWWSALSATLGLRSKHSSISSPISRVSEGVLCSYSGSIFCANCIAPEKMILPSYVASTWDFTPRTVSLPASELLSANASAPVLTFRHIHPAVKRMITTIQKVHTLRRELTSLQIFFKQTEKCKSSCTCCCGMEAGHAAQSRKLPDSNGRHPKLSTFLPCEAGAWKFWTTLKCELLPRLPGKYWLDSDDVCSLSDLMALRHYHRRLRKLSINLTFGEKTPFSLSRAESRAESVAESQRLTWARTPLSSPDRVPPVLAGRDEESQGSSPEPFTPASLERSKEDLMRSQGKETEPERTYECATVLRRDPQPSWASPDLYLMDLHKFTVYWEEHVARDCKECQEAFEKFKLRGRHNLTLYSRI